MTNEHSGISRRGLMRAAAVGVPAASLLAFGSTLVTATSASAVSVDGYWGEETSAGLQRFMNAVRGAGLSVDGVISSQPSSMAPSCSGIVSGWDWVDDAQASGSPTMLAMYQWLGSGTSSQNIFLKVQSWGANVTGYSITGVHIKLLQEHYGLTADGTLDSPSLTIEALQNEINQYVG